MHVSREPFYENYLTIVHRIFYSLLILNKEEKELNQILNLDGQERISV